MNEKERKAIEYYQDKEISFGVNFDTEKLLMALGITEEDSFENHQIRFKTLLNLIEKLQKENEEKNKIIYSMIKVMIENSICDYFIKEKCKNYAGENGKTCDECIKQYFENKEKEV